MKKEKIGRYQINAVQKIVFLFIYRCSFLIARSFYLLFLFNSKIWIEFMKKIDSTFLLGPPPSESRGEVFIPFSDISVYK